MFALIYCRHQGVLGVVTITASRSTSMFYVGEVWWLEELWSLHYCYSAIKCYIVLHSVGASD